MQTLPRPSPQSASGVFQNLIDLYLVPGPSAEYTAQEPLESLSIYLQAFLFTGVSP